MENQSDKKVKTLRIDNGLEFFNRSFDEFCDSKGIQRHMTCAYTAQQNSCIVYEHNHYGEGEKYAQWLWSPKEIMGRGNTYNCYSHQQDTINVIELCQIYIDNDVIEGKKRKSNPKIILKIIQMNLTQFNKL